VEHAYIDIQLERRVAFAVDPTAVPIEEEIGEAGEKLRDRVELRKK
jgi:hypothetical protein